MKRDGYALMNRTRIQFIDIARGISIFCIILGHLGNLQINRVVFTFHVPIFFFITGYFIDKDSKLKYFFKKKIRTLLLPYACVCIVIILLGIIKSGYIEGWEAAKNAAIQWIYASLYGAGDSYTNPFYIPSIGAIWFIWATFWGSLFLRLCLALNNELVRVLGIGILFTLGLISTRLFWFPFSIQAGLCATLFMYIGYLVRTLIPAIRTLSKEIKIAATFFSAIIWLSFIKDFQSFWLVHCDIGRGFIDIFGSICGCYIVLLISRFIDQRASLLSKFFSYFGKNSLLVLGIHIIELKLFAWNQLVDEFIVSFQLPTQSKLYIIILGKFILVIGATIICRKLKFIRYVFCLK